MVSRVSNQDRPPDRRTQGGPDSVTPTARGTQVSSTGPGDRPSFPELLQLRDDTAMPLYQQIEQQLEALIHDGTLPAGTVLPAERQLAESLGLSRATVQRAYSALRQRKLLLSQGRRGFLIQGVGPRLHPGMDRLKGFTEEMRLLGKVPSSRILERRVVSDRSIASIFGLPSPARFLKLVRVRYGDGVPLSREVGWYNLAEAPELEHGDLSGSLYAFLAETSRKPLIYGDQTVEATHPSQEECEIFGFEEPVPCLLIKRSSYTHGNVMMEYVEGLFRGDAYSYRLRLGR
jgi:GntR family transcriptional regulator